MKWNSLDIFWMCVHRVVHRLNVGEDREGESMKTLTFWLEQQLSGC